MLQSSTLRYSPMSRPINYRHQVYNALGWANVGDIRTPYLITSCNGQTHLWGELGLVLFNQSFKHSLRLARVRSSASLFLVHATIMSLLRASWVRSTASQEKTSWFTIKFMKLVSKPSLMLQGTLRFFTTVREYKKG